MLLSAAPLRGARLKADFHSAENIARSTFSAHFLLNCSNQIQISEHISKESEREKSIARHFPLNGNPPLRSTRILSLFLFFRPDLSDTENVQGTWGAFWVKIVTGWVCVAIYLWTLVAPICMPNRDFSTSFVKA